MLQSVGVSLAFSLLFVGCYSQTEITKDESVPDDEVAFFYLKDGTYVESLEKAHDRIEGGFHVTGWRFKDEKNGLGKFSGVILDSDIQKVTAKKFDWRQSLVVGVPIVFSAFLLVGLLVWGI